MLCLLFPLIILNVNTVKNVYYVCISDYSSIGFLIPSIILNVNTGKNVYYVCIFDYSSKIIELKESCPVILAVLIN